MPLSGELAALWEAQPEGQRPPGLAVAAAVGGEIVYAAGFGARDAEAGLPATPDTVFGVASVAKPFTALAVLLLAERGVLSVADPVRTWLPELRLPRARSGAATVTIHHLLTHTSGLPPEVALPSARARDMLGDPDLDRLGLTERQRSRLGLMQQRGELIDTYEELIERLAEADVPALGPPGRCFSYSGEGYALLAAIVERASGQGFPGYVHEHILDPLGMAGTGFRPGTFEGVAQTHPVSRLYAAASADGVPVRFPSPAWWASGRIHGHANMVSTARDLVRFAAMLAAGGEIGGRRVASRSTIGRMLAPHVPLPTGGFYGYGLFVRPDHGGPGSGVTLGEHAGGGKGAGAHLAVAARPGVGAVALANLAWSPFLRRLALGGLNALSGLPRDPPVETFPEHPIAPERLARLVGTYRWNDADEGMRFELHEGVLEVHLSGRALPCRPVADDGMVVCGPELHVRFLLRGGRAWALFDGARVSRRDPSD